MSLPKKGSVRFGKESTELRTPTRRPPLGKPLAKVAQSPAKRHLRQRKYPEIDWDKFMKLFTDRHARTLYERHVKAIDRICEVYGDGLIVRDLENIKTIMEATHGFAVSGGEPASVLIDPLCRLVRLAGGSEAPILMKTATEGFSATKTVTETLKFVGKLILSPFPAIQMAAAESLTAFATLSSEREQKKVLKEAQPKLAADKPVLQVFPTADAAVLVDNSGAVECTARALLRSYHDDGIGVVGVLALSAKSDSIASEDSLEAPVRENPTASGPPVPRLFVEEVKRDEEEKEKTEESIPENDDGFEWSSALAVPHELYQSSSIGAQEGSTNGSERETSINPLTRQLQLLLLSALATFSRYPPSASTVIQTGALVLLPHYFRADLDDALMLNAVQIVWNCLEHCHGDPRVEVVEGDEASHDGDEQPRQSQFAAKTLATLDTALCFKELLQRTLSDGFRSRDKELRNELLAMLTLFARFDGSHHLFLASGILPDVLLPHATYHLHRDRQSDRDEIVKAFLLTSSPEDFEMMYLTLNLISQLSWDPGCLRVIDHARFISALLAYLLPDFAPPCKWNAQQLASVRLAALSLLFHLAPRCAESFNFMRGNSVALNFLREVFARDLRRQDPNAPPEPAGIHRSAEEVDEEMALQHGILRLLLQTALLFRDEIGNEGGVSLLLSLFKDRLISPSLRSDAGLALSILCESSPENREIFVEEGGIGVIVGYLSYDPDDSTRRDSLLASALACLWGCGIRDPPYLNQFLLHDGFDALMDLVDVCPLVFRGAVLGLIADFLEDDTVKQHAEQWRSRDGKLTAPQLFVTVWEDEEKRLGLQQEINDDEGIILDPQNCLSVVAKSELPEDAVSLSRPASEDTSIALQAALYPRRTALPDQPSPRRSPGRRTSIIMEPRTTPSFASQPARPSSNIGMLKQAAGPTFAARGLGVSSPASSFCHVTDEDVAKEVSTLSDLPLGTHAAAQAAAPASLNATATATLNESTVGLGTMIRQTGGAEGSGEVLSQAAAESLLCVDARVKIHAIFRQLGFSGHEKSLTVHQLVKLPIIEAFMDLRTAEVYREMWEELRAESIRPTTPDADALVESVAEGSHVGAVVQRDQESLIRGHQATDLDQEGQFLDATIDNVQKLLGRIARDSHEKKAQNAQSLGHAKKLKLEQLTRDKIRHSNLHLVDGLADMAEGALYRRSSSLVVSESDSDSD